MAMQFLNGWILSGNNHHASQSNTAAQPVVDTVNGNHVLVGNATSRTMTFETHFNMVTMTYYNVCGCLKIKQYTRLLIW